MLLNGNILPVSFLHFTHNAEFMFYNYFTHIRSSFFPWIVLSAHFDLALQGKPHFDVVFPCITARCDLFKNNVSRYGSVNALRGHFDLVTTLKRGEGVEMSKLDIENLTSLTKQVFFGECLDYFCP